MNILVTGANGQLGNCMKVLAADSSHRFHFTDAVGFDTADSACDGGVRIERLDITDADAVDSFISNRAIDAVVNCAAWTNVDAAEDNLELCRRLNATAVGYMARSCEKHNALFIHISTDYVFGGNFMDSPANEDMPAAPTGVYGLTKLEGEKLIQESGCRGIIIRTAWLYSPYGKNFVKTMLNLTSTKEEIKVVNDQIGTPTYAFDLAKTIFKVLENYSLKPDTFKTGTEVFHYSNMGSISWFDFASKINELASHKCRVLPCTSAEFPSKVVRPPYSVLDKSRIMARFGVEVPQWEDSLKECLTILS